MSCVLQLADDSHFSLDASLLRYMLLSLDLSNSPGRYWQGPIFVRDERAEATGYEAPSVDLAPALLEEMLEQLWQPTASGALAAGPRRAFLTPDTATTVTTTPAPAGRSAA
jgi:hypothetical protein